MIAPNYVMTATITRVIDGDTVVATVSPGFHIHMENMKFRLHGVNTPELTSKVAAERTAANLAKTFVSDTVLGKKVLLQTLKMPRTGEDLIDSFGRYLAIIYYDDVGTQKSLNQELIAKGLAVAYQH